MLYIGSDHAGFTLKERLKGFLQKKGVAFEDLGANSEESVDYTDYAAKVAKKVAQDPKNRGIITCGTGIGVSIAANKIAGIRAAVIYDDFTAKSASEHNNANIACFGGRTQKAKDVEKWVGIWLTTPFSSDERHQRRIRKIAELEKGACRK